MNHGSPSPGREGVPGSGWIAAVAIVGALLLAPVTSSIPWWWPGQGTFVETAHVTPNDADEPSRGSSHWGVHFGSAVAMDGRTLVVGTQFDRHSDGTNTAGGTGADWAYVFELQQKGVWKQIAKLIPDDAHEGDAFGFSIALDEEGGVIVAGNPAAEKIYIFERAPSESRRWIQTASVSSPTDSPQTPAHFGHDVAVAGETVITGRHDTIYLYERIDGDWKPAGSAKGGVFVAAEGSTLATSSWDSQTQQNRFLIYERADGVWSQRSVLDPAGQHADQATQPSAVDISRDEAKIILGAPIDRRILGVDPGEQGTGFQGVGSAWIYELMDGEWVQTADIPNPAPGPGSAAFGHAVAIEDDLAIVGAPWSPYQGAASGSGAAHVYKQVADEWVLVSNLRNHDNGPYAGGDVFGEGVAIEEKRIAVGAPFDDQRRDGTPLDDDGDVPPCIEEGLVWGCDEGENAGSVYVFEPVQKILGAQ